MQRNQIPFNQIHALPYASLTIKLQSKQARYLDDVNLSTGWPRALPRDGPERWPSGTSIRHMFEVKDDDGFVEGLFRADPIAVSSIGPRLDDIHGIREHEEFVLGS